MSDLRIALVAEGKTDLIIIEAALKSILDHRPFTLHLLQPEISDPFGGGGPHGGGWSGVYRWCRQLVSMHDVATGNPSLSGFDLIVLHVDADVAGMNYQSANINDGRADLPCQLPCPPAADSVDALRQVVWGWLDLPIGAVVPARWIFCNPSMSSEAWLVTALHHDAAPNIMTRIECYPELENWLAQRPIREGRLIRNEKKQTSAYRDVAPRLTAAWEEVCHHCTQASRFGDEVRAALT